MIPLSIVDAHVHLWDPAHLRYAWLDGLPPLNRKFLPAHFSSASASTNVKTMIFVESGADPSMSLEEVKWASSLAEEEPRLKGIVAHAALEKGRLVEHELRLLSDFPLVKGVRRLLQSERDANFCLQPGFLAGIGLLAGFGFTFDLCVRQDQLPAVTELVRRVPQVTYILDHCGKPGVRDGQREPWAKHLKQLAAMPNTVCKISGLTTEADHEKWQPDDLKFYLEWTLEVFGFDRVMFGSDWPVAILATNYERWLETAQQTAALASEAERSKLFQTNAERIYHV